MGDQDGEILVHHFRYHSDMGLRKLYRQVFTLVHKEDGMRTLIIAASLLCASLAYAGPMSQADCPPDTIFNSSVNKCYQDPNSDTATRERREQDRLRQEQKDQEEQRRHNKEMENRMKNSGHSETIEGDPAPVFIYR